MRKNNIRIAVLAAFILIGLAFNLGIVKSETSVTFSSSTYSSSSSNPQYYYSDYYGYSFQDAAQYWPALSNPETCQATRDFIMSIIPGSCTPQVIRSDLLEEQNVPVFCKVDIIKINPLIDINDIKSVRYTRKSADDNVLSVSFYPNRAALRYQQGILDNPYINDVGYVVVILKRIAAEKDMPDSIRVNLTGVLDYDMGGFLGAGQNQYYLDVKNDVQWNLGDNFRENSFFKGRGYLRADWIDNGRAQISIYRDKDQKLATFTLNEGQTSGVYYMPGFYCKAGVQVKLDGFSAGVKKAKLEVDGDEVWVTEGQKFLNSECKVTSIDAVRNQKSTTPSVWRDVSQSNFDRLTFSDLLNGNLETPFKIWYKNSAGEEKSIDIATIEKRTATTTSKLKDDASGQTSELKIESNQIVLFDKDKKFSYIFGSQDEKIAGKKITLPTGKTSNGFILVNSFDIIKIQTPVYETLAEKRTVKIVCKGKSYELTDESKKNATSNATSTGTETLRQTFNSEINDKSIPGDVRDNFDKARSYAETIKSYYGDVAEGANIFSAKALYELGTLARNIGLNSTADSIFRKIISDYPNSGYSSSAGQEQVSLNVPAAAYNEHRINLIEIQVPGKDDASADFTIKKQGQPESILEKKKGETELFGDNRFKIVSIIKDRVELIYYNYSENKRETSFILTSDDRSRNFGDYYINLDSLDVKQIAKVSILSRDPSATSESDFTFEVGIEKRAIKLSPDQLKERIKNLNETIKRWEGIVENLGKAVEVMKGACFATSTVLMVKNLFSNLEGGANARQAVMKSWYARCQNEAGSDRTAFNNCVKGYETQIENDIKIYEENLKKVNDNIIKLQEENKFPGSESVNRKAVEEKLRQDSVFSSGFNYVTEQYDSLTSQMKDVQNSISGDELQKISQKLSLTDLRDLDRNIQTVSNPTASDVMKKQAGMDIQKILDRGREKLKSSTTAGNSGECYKGNANDVLSVIKTTYFPSGVYNRLAQKVPVPGTFGGCSGFYAEISDATVKLGGKSATEYQQNGLPTEIWIKNIGQDKLSSDGEPIQVATFNSHPYSIFKLSVADSSALFRAAQKAVKIANEHFGMGSYDYEGYNVMVDKTAKNINEPRCQDFMSPTDCSILFNVCDPVMCPSSRCDLGGAYPVDNVVQTGIIGSIALCFPNINEGIVVPVCLTGIHAGLESYLSILKSTRDCLQEQLDTGRVTGICDEIESIYLCEFFWRQIGPFLDMLIPKMLETVYGQGMKGGGEYLTVQTAWQNMQKSIDYFKNDYAVNSMKAFNARSTGDIGGEFCKMFVSQRYPNNKDFFDNLLKPDSPVQYTAWFDEIPYTEVTAPSTSQYKVFYHIYAGKDEGISYQIYLVEPQNLGIGVQQSVVVKTGFITRGSQKSEAVDFLAPAGYQKICVRINGKDDCGFKKVTTEFTLNYLSDKYYEEQLNQSDITTKDECISGEPSVLGLTQTANPEEAVQNALTPNLEKKGVVRVCSKNNPGPSEGARWKNVGYCDDESLRCWLDTNSVKDVIKNKNIQAGVIQSPDSSGQTSFAGTMDIDKINSIFGIADERIGLIKDKIKLAKSSSEMNSFLAGVVSTEKISGGDISLKDVLDSLQSIEDNAPTNMYKAKARYYKFRIYYEITKGFDQAWKLDQQVNKAIAAIPAGSASATEPNGDGYVVVSNSNDKNLNGKLFKKLGNYWYQVSSADDAVDSLTTKYTFSQIQPVGDYTKATQSQTASSTATSGTGTKTSEITPDTNPEKFIFKIVYADSSGRDSFECYSYFNLKWYRVKEVDGLSANKGVCTGSFSSGVEASTSSWTVYNSDLKLGYAAIKSRANDISNTGLQSKKKAIVV